MNDSSRVTQRDVAIQAGFDKSTVSLALSGSPRVAEPTRKRIEAIARKMGYRPDPAIVQLARHRWSGHETGAGSVLAYLVERQSSVYCLQRRHLAAVRQRAEERGYRVDEFDLSEYSSGRGASRVLYHRGVRGLIVPAMPMEAGSHLASMDWEKFTVVGCSLGWHRASCDVVAPDVFEGTARLWREVLKKGYTRIGAALFRHEPEAVDDRTRFAASAFEQSRLPVRFERIPFHLGAPNDRDSFMDWFRRYRPDVIVGLVGHPCAWLQANGFRVPEDVAYACLNVLPETGLAGIEVQFEEIGRRAVDYLISEMRDNHWGLPDQPETLLLAPRWTDGMTLPEVSGRSSAVGRCDRMDRPRAPLIAPVS